jgi:hypothetical protein
MTLTKCFLLRTSAANYAVGRAYCSEAGGSLVMYKAREEQLMVETVFKGSG